jgi:secretion/DNA translocation related TadE-like protein
MTHSERGSATIHTLLAAVLLITALAAATLWSAISTARHKLTTAADLTALSAARSLAPPAGFAAPDTPCETATRIAILNEVRLANCDATTDAVTVRVSLELDLPLGRPTLSATARAGPL